MDSDSIVPKSERERRRLKQRERRRQRGSERERVGVPAEFLAYRGANWLASDLRYCKPMRRRLPCPPPNLNLIVATLTSDAKGTSSPVTLQARLRLVACAFRLFRGCRRIPVRSPLAPAAPVAATLAAENPTGLSSTERASERAKIAHSANSARDRGWLHRRARARAGRSW